jgi:putative ABC transport system substrate-binding protein
MKRREFITLLGGAAVAWPLAAWAQQPATPIIGFLSGLSPQGVAPYLVAFHEGLRQAGFVEGQSVAIEYRWAHGDYSLLPALAGDLVARKVTVLVATGGALYAAKAATSTIPVVILSGGDPVKEGFVSSFNRPGGNITGVAMFAFSLGPKRLEVLRELLPSVERVAVLSNPRSPLLASKEDLKQVEAAARGVGQRLELLKASSEGEITNAFGLLPRSGAGALLVIADPYFNSMREQIVALAAQAALPAIYEWREFAVLGGLMSYGSSITDSYRQVGIYTGRVLRGDKPAELPIMQTIKVELVINQKTAKGLGLTFPITLLGRADEVIE